MKRLKPGDLVDQYEILGEEHRGGMARLYVVRDARGTVSDTELLMKVPRMSPQDDSETVLGFEVERLILPRLKTIASIPVTLSDHRKHKIDGSLRIESRHM